VVACLHIGVRRSKGSFLEYPMRYNVTVAARPGWAMASGSRIAMAQIEDTSPAPARGEIPLGRRLSLIGLGTVLLLLVVLLGAGYAGYQAGLIQQQQQYRATQAADLQLQYDLGLGDLAAGRYEVAIARFEYIVQLDPQYRDAGLKLAEARQALAAPPTPRPSPTPGAATASPTPAATSGEAQAIYDRAQDAYAVGDWDGVITALGELHAVDAEFEAVRVDGMLYVALRNRGIASILGDAMEAGMFDLDQAAAFGPLDTEALNYRAWARLYLAAQSYWGLDWRQAMEILQQLYLIAPYFRDTNTRLYQATVNYAHQLAAAGEACAAAEHFLAAQAIFADDPAVAPALAEAQAACAAAPDPQSTPGEETPGVEATDTPAP
jgi:tetratricopeptide (TPR) repeat protein